MDAMEVFAILSKRIKMNGITPDEIKAAVETYLKENGITSPIAHVKQTETGAIITIVDEFSGQTQAVIYNGAEGAPGYTPQKGIDYFDGKTAYEYAKEGGFTGTEQDFAHKLSQENYTKNESDNKYQIKGDYALRNEIPNVPVQSVNGKTGEVSLAASDVGALPDTTSIPSNTSDLTNDSGFVTKAVNDLANYYLKTETYSRTELDNKLSAIPKFAIEVVSSLPASNISVTTVYLVPSGNEQDNLYTEYIYVNGTWEYLGKQSVDLTGYALKTEIPTKLSALTNDAGFITNTVSELINYYTKAQIDEKVNQLQQEIVDIKGGTIPEYWNGTYTEVYKDSSGNVLYTKDYTKYIDEKIARIKELLDSGGINCFAFPFITDIHMESNLGKKAPLLMDKIMKACALPYALCGGDNNTRHGANHNLEYLKNEWLDIDAMFEPILDRLLIQDGNHDGSAGIIDANGDGVADDINADGVVDSYDKNVYNFTPEQKYSRIRRKASLINGVKFDETGNAFYVDDKIAKVRYIMLNSHNNLHEENKDGSAKYNNMTHFRFGQAQYDFLINDALTSVTDGYSVIVCCHVPLDRTQEYIYWGGETNSSGSLADGSIADCTIMQRLLNAYKKKDTYSGTFNGTASGGKSYTNYADTGSADWKVGSGIGSSGALDGGSQASVVTNYIRANPLDKIRFKNFDFFSGGRLAFYDSNKTYIGVMAWSTITQYGGYTTDANTGISTYVMATTDSKNIVNTLTNAAYVRFEMTTPTDTPIITINEEIVEVTLDGYDKVSVNADFTNAKGNLLFMVCGHAHADNIWMPSLIYNNWGKSEFPIVTSRSDGKVENTSALQAERVQGTITEQSFDVYVVNTKTKQCNIVKIGAGADRSFSF